MKNELTAQQSQELLSILKTRFEKNMNRHPKLLWIDVQAKLENTPQKLWSLDEMEVSGGEPDVVDLEGHSGEIMFYDCVAESPKGRRSICYDQEALDSRKEHKPAHSAVGMAMEMGVEILTEEQYRELQKLISLDLKTSSWIKTPDHIRKLGGAIFGDRRFNTVFVYHNGAESYYGGRGFRSLLKI